MWRSQKVNLSESHSCIVVIDETVLSGIFASTHLTRKLFCDKVVVNYVPFRPVKANVTYIMQETSCVIGSNLGYVDRLLITFGSLYEASVRTFVCLDIYGNTNENLALHVHCHINHALNIGKCNPLFFQTIL